MLIHADGFQANDLTTKWDSATTGSRRSGTTARFAGGAFLEQGVAQKSIAAVSEVFVSAAFVIPAAATQLFSFYGDSGATQHITIMRTSAGKIEVRRGSSTGTVLATGATTVPALTWVQVEARVTIADAGGIVQVRLYGGTSNEISFTGDTKNAGTATTIDRVTFTSSTSAGKCTDALICDTTGSQNNTWSGQASVLTISPTADATYSDGAPVLGPGPHWAMVNDLPIGTADGLGLTAPGKETFTFAGILATTSIKAVVANIATFGPASTALKRLIRSGGTDYLGPTINLAASAKVGTPDVLELHPATGTPWTAAQVNALEFGVQATTGSPLLVDLYFEVIYDSSPNVVTVDGGGTIGVVPASQTSGTTVDGGGGIAAGAMTDGYPAPTPTDPTLTLPDPDVEPVIQEVLVTYPAPTLVQGVPVGWEPS